LIFTKIMQWVSHPMGEGSPNLFPLFKLVAFHQMGFAQNPI
jgi:hypothetical protein